MGKVRTLLFTSHVCYNFWLRKLIKILHNKQVFVYIVLALCKRIFTPFACLEENYVCFVELFSETGFVSSQPTLYVGREASMSIVE